MSISDISTEDSLDWDYEKSFQEVSLRPFPSDVDSLSPCQRSFGDRVQLLSENNKVSLYVVDSRVLVKGPSPEFRANAVKNWEEKRSQASWMRWVHIGGLLTSIAVTALGVACCPPVAVVGLIATIAESVFVGQRYDAMNQAQAQIDRWSQHPAQRVADERAKAYKQGFFYCLNHGLKGCYEVPSSQNVLHPHEVTWLYEQCLVSMMKDVAAQKQRQNISSEEMARWVEQFIAQNPLSLRAIDYAYEPQLLKREILERWNPSFNAYQQDVTSLQNHFHEKMDEIRNRAKNELSRLTEQRDLALALPRSIKDAADRESKRLRDERLRIEGLSDLGRERVIQDCKQALRDHETIYQLAAIPIDIYYDKCEEDVKNWKADCLKRLEREKAVGIAPYFRPGLDLFANAFDNWQNQRLIDAGYYHSQEFWSENLPPIPSAPLWEGQ